MGALPDDGTPVPLSDGVELSAKVVRGTAVLLAARVVNAACLFAFSIVMARSLGRDEYGLIALAMGIAGILEIVGDMGMNSGAARYVPFHQARAEWDAVRRIVSINVASKAATAVMLGALIYLLAGLLGGFFGKPIEPLLRIAALVLAMNVLGGAAQGLLRGLQRLGAMSVANTVRDLVWLGTSMVLVLAGGRGVEGAVWGYAAGAVAWAVVNLAAMAQGVRADVPERAALAERYQGAMAMTLLTFGVPVMLTNLIMMVIEWTSTLVIGYHLPVMDLSAFNVAYGMVSMPLVLTQAIGWAMMPAMSHAYGQGRADILRGIWQGAVKLVGIVLFPIAALLMALSVPGVDLLYGTEYSGAALPLAIMAIMLFLKPVGVICLQMLAAMAMQLYILRAIVVSLALNVALNLVLVPAWGIEGAALSATATFVVNSALLYRVARSRGGVALDWRGAGLTVISSLAAAAAALGVFLATGALGGGEAALLARLAPAGLVALAVYVLLIRGLRVVGGDELERMRAVGERSALVRWVLRVVARD